MPHLCLGFWLLSLGAFSSPDPPKQPSRIKARLFTIEANLQRLESTLRGMGEESERLSQEVDKLELERALTSARIEKHQLSLEDSQNQIRSIEGQKALVQEEAAGQKTRISKRIRHLYKRGNLGYAKLLLKQSRLADLINSYHYAKILTERDQRVLQDYQQSLSELTRLKGELEENQRLAAEATQALAEQQNNLQALLDRRNQTLSQINRETNKKRRLLADYELEREELEIMLRRLTNADADPMGDRISITRYSGRLNWPLKGRIKRGFGVIIDPEFNTKRRHNGIKIETKKGKPVRSVYSGRVLYADWFKNYGNLVILDHGDKVTTFYAHCDTLLVEKSDYVERDQIIAYAGDTGSLEGPMLHFEIRRKAKPENPRGWLKKR